MTITTNYDFCYVALLTHLIISRTGKNIPECDPSWTINLCPAGLPLTVLADICYHSLPGTGLFLFWHPSVSRFVIRSFVQYALRTA